VRTRLGHRPRIRRVISAREVAPPRARDAVASYATLLRRRRLRNAATPAIPSSPVAIKTAVTGSGVTIAQSIPVVQVGNPVGAGLSLSHAAQLYSSDGILPPAGRSSPVSDTAYVMEPPQV
jgi:hypothetical protein